MSCSEQLRTQGLVDGELDGAEAEEAARHLEACAECQDFAGSTRTLSGAIRRHATRHDAAPELRARISRMLDAEPVPLARPRRSFWLGMGSGVGASALAAGLALFLLAPPPDPALVDAVADAHMAALMRGQTIAVVSSSHHTVKPWFAGRVPLSPPVADFARQGFALAGGRVDAVAGAPAAVVVYRHGLHEIDLFVWAAGNARLPPGGMRRGYRALLWQDRDLDFAAVSDMEKAELEKFVALVKAEPE
jgi:anti-sigma factor RsiW